MVPYASGHSVMRGITLMRTVIKLLVVPEVVIHPWDFAVHFPKSATKHSPSFTRVRVQQVLQWAALHALILIF